jgi:hypothetical protein
MRHQPESLIPVAAPARNTQVYSRLVAITGLVVLACWLAVLFLQRGNPWDETEHAHVAWLVSLGQRPIDDFFQHHQPVLWSILALYYRAGFTGPEVLIWGRVLVLASAVVSLVSLAAIGRRREASIVDWLGAVAFVVLNVALPDLFVIRPETISAAGFLAGLALWLDGRHRPVVIALAGAMLAFAVYASPRFGVLAGFLLLGVHSVRRWAVLVVAGVSMVGLYTLGSGFPTEYVWFNLRFSAYLQSIGDTAYGPPAHSWFVLAVTFVLPVVAALTLVHSMERPRAALISLYAALVFLICHYAAGRFRYPQAYAPFVVAVSIAWARTARSIDWQDASKPRAIAIVLSALCLIPGGVTLFGGAFVPKLDLLPSIRVRSQLAAMVPPGQTVLLFTEDHPITVKDSSYYGSPLWDGQDRLCRAVAGFRWSRVLPPCDIARTLREVGPFLVDRALDRAVRPAEIPDTRSILTNKYREAYSPNWPTYFRSVLWRQDSATSGTATAR